MSALDPQVRERLYDLLAEMGLARCPVHFDPPKTCGRCWRCRVLTEIAEAEQRGAARALLDAANEVPLFEFMLVMDIASEVAPAQVAAWLRNRAALDVTDGGEEQ